MARVRFELITTGLDLAGVFANALLGGIMARARTLDLFGFVMIGLVSGLGGGLIRDVLLQHGTPVALTNPAYIPTALAGLGTAFLVNVSQSGWDRVFTLLDAAALSLWATVGAQKALEVGLGWLPALLLGTITAVGGGITRDLMLLQVPAVFAGNRLFASVAIVVAAIVVVCSALHAPPGLGTAIAVLTGFALRLVANWRGWSLPYGLELQPRSIAFWQILPPSPLRRGRSRRRPTDDHSTDNDPD